jgi:hypothetical protein
MEPSSSPLAPDFLPFLAPSPPQPQQHQQQVLHPHTDDGMLNLTVHANSLDEIMRESKWYQFSCDKK